MNIILDVDEVMGLFDQRIVSARWLENNGEEVDKDIARMVRYTLEGVRRDLLERIEKVKSSSSDYRQEKLRLVG